MYAYDGMAISFKEKNMKFIEILNFFMHKFIVSHGVFEI